MYTSSSRVHPQYMLEAEILYHWKQKKSKSFTWWLLDFWSTQFISNSFHVPFRAAWMTLIATVMKPQHLWHISPPLNTEKMMFRQTSKNRNTLSTHFTLPAASTNLIVISHIDIKHQFLFHRLKSFGVDSFFVFWFRRVNGANIDFYRL